MTPTKLTIVSDGNVLELKSEIKGEITYRYVVSKSKKDTLLVLSKEQLDKGLRMEIFKII